MFILFLFYIIFNIYCFFFKSDLLLTSILVPPPLVDHLYQVFCTCAALNPDADGDDSSGDEIDMNGFYWGEGAA